MDGKQWVVQTTLTHTYCKYRMNIYEWVFYGFLNQHMLILHAHACPTSCINSALCKSKRTKS